MIAEALTGLRSRSCIIDGEAVACDDNGLASFERIRYRQHDGDVFLYAFDLIELNGDDLRRDPLQVRKAKLAFVVTAATAIRATRVLTVVVEARARTRPTATSQQRCHARDSRGACH
jgi:ATP-dependent DNA ligase